MIQDDLITVYFKYEDLRILHKTLRGIVDKAVEESPVKDGVTLLNTVNYTLAKTLSTIERKLYIHKTGVD